MTWKVKKRLQLSTLFKVSSEQILQQILSHSFLHHFADSHLQYAFQYPKTNNTIWVFTFVPKFMSKCTFFRLSDSLHLFDSFYLILSIFACSIKQAVWAVVPGWPSCENARGAPYNQKYSDDSSDSPSVFAAALSKSRALSKKREA